MITKEDSARKILKVLKKGHIFTCLRGLAKKAGFRTAGSRSFKNGLNLLIQKDVVKIVQSGWSSEERGVNRHPKGVVFLGDIFTLETDLLDLKIDEILSPEKVRYPPSQVDLETVFDGIDNSDLNNLLKSEGWKNCTECTTKPFTFITSKRLPLCSEHWAELSDRNIDWHKVTKMVRRTSTGICTEEG